MNKFKIGDRVVLIDLEGEPGYYRNFLGQVGVVLHLEVGVDRDMTEVIFRGAGSAPYTKNLRPAKQYYITKFKELYGE